MSVLAPKPSGISSSTASNSSSPAETRAALMVFFVVGSLVIVALNTGFALFPAAFQVFAALVTDASVWPQLSWDQFGTNLLFGLVGGLILGGLRLSRFKGRLVEEIAEAIGDRATLQAWDVGAAFVLMHVAISVLVGLLLALIGFAPSLSHPLEPMMWVGDLSPLGLAIGGAGGGPETAGWLLTGILLLIIVIGAIVSGALIGLLATVLSGSSVTLSTAAGGALSGGQSAIGRVLGVGMVLALSRLCTARVSRPREPVQAPLTMEGLRATHRLSEHRSDPFWRFEQFCLERGVALTLQNFAAELSLFADHLAARKAGALPRRLEDALSACFQEQWRLERLREPYLEFPKCVPPLAPTKFSLLYRGWLGNSVFNTILTGALFGSLYSAIVVMISSLFYLFATA